MLSAPGLLLVIFLSKLLFRTVDYIFREISSFQLVTSSKTAALEPTILLS